jgi:hypothetical protein
MRGFITQSLFQPLNQVQFGLLTSHKLAELLTSWVTSKA